MLGLLRTLEKIATKRSDPEPFEVGVTSLRIVGGRFAIEPRGEDLLKESVVTSLLCRVDRKMLVQLHSCLFEQLWRGDSEPAKGVGGESLEVKKKGVERAKNDSVPARTAYRVGTDWNASASGPGCHTSRAGEESGEEQWR